MARLLGRRGERRSRVQVGDRGGPRAIGVMFPLVVLAAAVVMLTLFCHHLLVAAADGEAVEVGTLPLYVAACCFLLAAGAVVVLQSIRVAQRVAGPEYRLIQSLRRIRAGDVSFRIHLRRSELLHELAAECNALLDWLNHNPPVGARTGTDVFEVGALDVDIPEGNA